MVFLENAKQRNGGEHLLFLVVGRAGASDMGKWLCDEVPHGSNGRKIKV